MAQFQVSKEIARITRTSVHDGSVTSFKIAWGNLEGSQEKRLGMQQDVESPWFPLDLYLTVPILSGLLAGNPLSQQQLDEDTSLWLDIDAILAILTIEFDVEV